MKHDFSRPFDDDKMRGISAFNIDEIMPDYYNDIPKEFYDMYNPWCRWQSDWFFNGISKDTVKVKDGINADHAWRHLYRIQSSFQPKHEHKMAAVAYLASLWFDLATK